MLILSSATGIVVITVILVHIWYRRRKQSIKMRHVVGEYNDSTQHLCSCFPSVFYAFQYRFIYDLLLFCPAAGIPGENMYDQEDGQWSMEEEKDKDGERMSSQLYSYQVLEAATCHFSNRNKLGSGGFGTVYKVIIT